MAPLHENSLNRLATRTSEYLTANLPRSVTNVLAARDTNTDWNKSAGTTPANNIPNQVVFALFGIIGAGFVITGIWFFFWAKNGGFYFREGDWEDYKSTVLRRKGPNGTTLSGATRTTDLGGGSVVGKRQRRMRYKDVESSIGTESEMSELKSERGVEREKSSKRGKKARGDEESVLGGADEPDEVVRAYRHEKPARVGGINRMPDGSAFEGSTADSHSDLLSNKQATPTNTPTKNKSKLRKDNYTGGAGSPGIRKVESTGGGQSGFWNRSGGGSAKKSDGNVDVAAEARKLQEKGRAAGAGSGRRDFSYNAGDDSTSASGLTTDERRARRASRSPRVPGSYAESDAGSDITGTKAYHHPIPGLGSGGGYADERRKKRAEREAGGSGYRRGGRGGDDELD